MMILRNYRIIAIAFCLLVSCDTDDDVSSSSGFYDGAISSASASALNGVWSIYKVGYEII